MSRFKRHRPLNTAPTSWFAPDTSLDLAAGTIQAFVACVRGLSTAVSIERGSGPHPVFRSRLSGTFVLALVISPSDPPPYRI